jgi:hypothetical protein
MSSNKRIFYACQAVGIADIGDTTNMDSTALVHGLQSVGMTTNFNLEQAFELGQIEIYENIEGTPDVEVTLEKVLDGYPLIYHMATTGVGTDSKLLANRSKQRCDLRLAILDEGNNHISSSNEEVEVYCSGLYVSSVSYSIPTDGNCTESVTLVGNEKQWLTGIATQLKKSEFADFDGTDSPVSSGDGGVQRREDVMLNNSILPAAIQGVNGSGVGNGWDSTSGIPRVHLQSINISTDFSREEILELGRKAPYYRPANFPIEVTCEIEAITTSGDFIGAYEYGDPALDTVPTASGNNTGEEKIYIELRAGYGFDLGIKNRLSSVSYGGGDAGGGNATTTYSYTNFNDLDVQHSGSTNSVTQYHFTKLGLGANADS